MAEHRFYVDKTPLPGPGQTAAIEGDPARRIAAVLRMRPGERLGLFDGVREFECELIEIRPNVRVRLLDELPSEAPAETKLTLYQALVRPNRFEWLLEKVTEIGVAQIVPILTDHAAVRTSEIGSSRLERWRRITIEATEQSGRRIPPSIQSPVSFPIALKHANGRRVFAWEGLRSKPAALQRSDAPDIALFIGPEGGWSDSEVQSAREAGATFMSLGPNILRAETAAIVASALLLSA